MQAPTIESSSISQPRPDVSPTEMPATAWKPLYRVGAVAAVLSVVIIPLAMIVFFAWPPPDFHPTASAVTDWFKVYHDNPFRGILDFDLLMLVGQIISIPLLLALYIALRKASPTFTAIALALGLMGAAMYCTTNQAFSMLVLSDQYAGATTEAQRASLVSAGQAMLATYAGTGFDVSYIMGGLALLIFAVVMLQSTVFNKATASVGILMGVLMLVPATAGTVGLILAFLSLVPLVFWDILIAITLFRLGSGVPQASGAQK